MRWPGNSKPITKQLLLLAVVVLLVAAATLRLLAVSGDALQNRSLTLSDPAAGATSRYLFSFKPATTATIQTIRFQVCVNDPFPETPCTPPNGFDASGATLITQNGDQNFTITSGPNVNEIVLNRPPAASNAQQSSYEFGGVVNPSSEGSYYVRVQTFAGSDASGPANGYGGIAFAINSGININVTVPPYLLFCAGITVQGYNCNSVSGNYVNFGELSSSQANQGSTQMLAATNAIDGYAIRVNGRTLTSGNNVIPALTGADISRPGVSQFGMNLRANVAPAGGQDVSGPGNGLPANGYEQANFFRFNSGDVVAVSATPDEARKYTATYIVNVSRDQAPGIYVSTMTYIALGNF